MGGDERDGSDSRDVRSIDEKLAPHDFVADFVWAAREVFRKPSVAVVSTALWWIPVLLGLGARSHKSPLRALIMLALGIFALGWLGAERTFFRLRREGKDVALRELVDSVLGFIGRFFRLGLWMGVIVVPVTVAVCVVTAAFVKSGNPMFAAGVISAVVIAVMVVLDLALTFVTPALAFSTDSVSEALRIGFRMIRQTWPRSGLYVLCPPLALNLFNAMYSIQIPLLTLVTTAALAVLALVAKGATAAFYLRERPVVSTDTIDTAAG